jgi:C-terminal processing protease CtpA/Prc
MPEVIDTVAIKNRFKDWPRYQLNIEEFKTYLGKKKTQDFEGIWETVPYKMAIKKIGNDYKGILINDLPPYWEEGQVKLEITNTDGKQRGVVYQRDHSKVENEKVEEIGQNYLQVSGYRLKRLFPVLPTETEVQNWLKLNGRNPYLDQLDKNTVYFRIPSFNPNYKKAIDSILVANKELLTHTPNLIIDIRGNGGGSDFSFSNIIPYLKTNEINVTGVEYLSTILNNQRMMDFVTKPEYKDFSNKQKEWAKKSFDTLQKHLGEFVLLDESFEDDDTNTADTILTFPKQVGIIIDGGVGSSAEQFLLAAKQSKKVKLFGTSTFGSLDIANMYSVKSPCGEYELGYSLSKSKRLPGYVLDERGIQPDFFISEDVPGYHWVPFVKTILEYPGKK